MFHQQQDFNIQNTELLKTLLNEKQYDVVIHFAGSAYMAESFQVPDKYYSNNVTSSHSLLEAVNTMETPAKIIFSSSCATYGIPAQLPITENMPQNPISPYGRSKLIVEWMLSDWHARYKVPYVVLRYFNAAGCHPEKRLGEIHDPEPHIIPRFIMAGLNKDTVQINGNAFPTPDGTCIRDYIHVWDLARAHVLAAEAKHDSPMMLNIGTGQGTSILEVLKTLENLLGYSLKIEWGSPREGDPPALVADASKAMRQFSWQPDYSSIEMIIQTAINWFESQTK